MSGGSYDYASLADHLDDVLAKRQGIDQLADRLASLDESEFPGARAAAVLTQQLLGQLRVWEAYVESQTRLLGGVWKAVEWWDSCDWGPDQVREALAALAVPPPTEPEEVDVVATVDYSPEGRAMCASPQLPGGPHGRVTLLLAADGTVRWLQ